MWQQQLPFSVTVAAEHRVADVCRHRPNAYSVFRSVSHAAKINVGNQRGAARKAWQRSVRFLGRLPDRCRRGR
jgi:hypothetical protein